jgi:hypothetical protein
MKSGEILYRGGNATEDREKGSPATRKAVRDSILGPLADRLWVHEIWGGNATDDRQKGSTGYKESSPKIRSNDLLQTVPKF